MIRLYLWMDLVKNKTKVSQSPFFFSSFVFFYVLPQFLFFLSFGFFLVNLSSLLLVVVDCKWFSLVPSWYQSFFPGNRNCAWFYNNGRSWFWRVCNFFERKFERDYELTKKTRKCYLCYDAELFHFQSPTKSKVSPFNNQMKHLKNIFRENFSKTSHHPSRTTIIVYPHSNP